MTNSTHILGRFNGQFIVTDKPMNLLVNKPLIIRANPGAKAPISKKAADASMEERMMAFRKLVELSANDPVIPLETLRRDTDEHNKGYGY